MTVLHWLCRASEYYQPEGLKADSIPSLQRLCERSLAESAVEPRTCLQIMEYADACGAEVLKQFCLGVGPLCSHMLPVLLCYIALCQALLPAVLPRGRTPQPPCAPCIVTVHRNPSSTFSNTLP